jgi:RNAse (barnase) inhibitor barstar
MTVEELKTPSWACIHFVSAEAAAPLRQAAPGRVLATIDGGQIEEARQLFAFLAEALGFPDYFGHNWDALDECLRDLSWRPGTGYVLFVDHAARLWERGQRTAGTFVEVWLDAACEWNREGIPFHLIFVW